MIQIPDWAVHLVALAIMSVMAGYVRLLVRSVITKIEHHAEIDDMRFKPLEANATSTRKFLHWINDCLFVVSSHTNTKLPDKPE